MKVIEKIVVSKTPPTNKNVAWFDVIDRRIKVYNGGLWTASQGAKYGTKEELNGLIGYIPAEGEIIVYTDYYVDEDGKKYPSMKIGTGNAYIQDLAFVGDIQKEEVIQQLKDADALVSDEDRVRWNGKLNIDDDSEVVGETLIFNRN